MKRKANSYNLPPEVNALNGLLHYPADPRDRPQFQLDPTAKVILLDNVTFGPGVTIAAGENARISIEASHLHHCTIAASKHSSIYVRETYVNNAVIRASTLPDEPFKRMLLEYLRLTDNTYIENCTLVSGKRYGDNRIFHLANCELSGKIKFKGHGILTGACIGVKYPQAIEIQHGYADRKHTKIRPELQQEATDPKSNAAAALLGDIAALASVGAPPSTETRVSVDLDPLEGVLDRSP